jgi:hypothetical protein
MKAPLELQLTEAGIENIKVLKKSGEYLLTFVLLKWRITDN